MLSAIDLYLEACHEEKLEARRERKKEMDHLRHARNYAANPDIARQQKKAQYRADPDKFIERVGKWRGNNPEYVKNYMRKWREDNWEKVQSDALLRTYGITLEQKNAMLAAQGHRCAICLGTEPGGKGTWHTDHRHKPFKLRGILCSNCNMLVGHAKENTGTLAAAIEYLKEHS